MILKKSVINYLYICTSVDILLCTECSRDVFMRNNISFDLMMQSLLRSLVAITDLEIQTETLTTLMSLRTLNLSLDLLLFVNWRVLSWGWFWKYEIYILFKSFEKLARDINTDYISNTAVNMRVYIQPQTYY